MNRVTEKDQNKAFKEGRIMRIGYLKKDINEMRTPKRCWWRTAYRIVDDTGQDIIVPWSWTKREARETAKAHNITLIED